MKLRVSNALNRRALVMVAQVSIRGEIEALSTSIRPRALAESSNSGAFSLSLVFKVSDINSGASHHGIRALS
jgi:hypothetical protein